MKGTSAECCTEILQHNDHIFKRKSHETNTLPHLRLSPDIRSLDQRLFEERLQQPRHAEQLYKRVPLRD